MIIEDRRGKFERTKQMCPLKQEIISYLFDYVARHPRGQWYRYKGDFNFDGKSYELECDCMWDNEMFSYRNMHISHKQIEIDVDELVREGLLN